jgi:hypothetical protein
VRLPLLADRRIGRRWQLATGNRELPFGPALALHKQAGDLDKMVTYDGGEASKSRNFNGLKK